MYVMQEPGQFLLYLGGLYFFILLLLCHTFFISGFKGNDALYVLLYSQYSNTSTALRGKTETAFFVG